MELITLILIAVGLTFDTFAVSISTGWVASHIRFWQATKIAAVLALFQAFMPFIGRWFDINSNRCKNSFSTFVSII